MAFWGRALREDKESPGNFYFLFFPVLLEGGGLDGLPLRVSNEGLLRPRVARAQETI
jgi:hypothetical protein